MIARVLPCFFELFEMNFVKDFYSATGDLTIDLLMAGAMGLEPTTYAVTGRHCNQLNYAPAL